MSGILMEAVAVEVETPKLAAPETKPTDKITECPMPSIWSFEKNIEWIIDGIIPLGTITLLSGESGGGKTWLAYAIAGAAARGEPFADFKVQHRPALYLDGENPLCLAN